MDQPNRRQKRKKKIVNPFRLQIPYINQFPYSIQTNLNRNKSFSENLYLRMKTNGKKFECCGCDICEYQIIENLFTFYPSIKFAVHVNEFIFIYILMWFSIFDIMFIYIYSDRVADFDHFLSLSISLSSISFLLVLLHFPHKLHSFQFIVCTNSRIWYAWRWCSIKLPFKCTTNIEHCVNKTVFSMAFKRK